MFEVRLSGLATVFLATVFLATMCCIVTGCSSPYKEALRRADRAITLNDERGAYEALKSACEMRSDDVKTCARAADARQRFIHTSLRNAADACDASDGLACIQWIRPIEHIVPQTETLALREQAFSLMMNACLDIDEFDLFGVIATRACLKSLNEDTSFKDIAQDTAFRDIERRETHNAAAQLNSAAAGSNSAAARLKRLESTWRGIESRLGDYPLTYYVMQDVDRCLDGKPSSRANVDRIKRITHNDIAVGVDLTLRGTHLSEHELCSHIESQTGGRVYCDSTSWANATLDIDVDMGRVDHQVARQKRVHRYQSGVQTYVNPEADQLSTRIALLEADLARARTSAELSKANCQSARQEWDYRNQCGNCYARRHMLDACNRSEAEIDAFNTRIREINHLQARLNRTPAMIENPQYSNYTYTERTHTFRKKADVRVEFTMEPSIRKQRHPRADWVTGFQNFTASSMWRDTEHDGFPEAGLARDPLRAPTEQQLTESITKALREKLDEIIRTQLLKTRKEVYETRCQQHYLQQSEDTIVSKDIKRECFLAQAYLKGQNPRDAWLNDAQTTLKKAGYTSFECR